MVLESLLRCPSCGSPGAPVREWWACQDCGASFPVLFNRIFDFRLLPHRDDLSFAHRSTATSESIRLANLRELYITSSFASLVRAYFSHFNAPADILQAEAESMLPGGASDFWLPQIFSTIPIPSFPAKTGTVALDMGCGGGRTVAQLAPHFAGVIGIDADPARLILAQKYCDEMAVENVLLACAFGERLPLPTNSLSLVTAVEVLEHVTDQAAFISEIRRALKPSGELFLTTPNRFALTREPHVNVWGVGYLPRTWQNKYVRLVRGVPYVGKRNLARWELATLLRNEFGPRWEFVRPQRRRYTLRGRVANVVLQVPFIRHLAALTLHGYQVVAHKPPIEPLLP